MLFCRRAMARAEANMALTPAGSPIIEPPYLVAPTGTAAANEDDDEEAQMLQGRVRCMSCSCIKFKDCCSSCWFAKEQSRNRAPRVHYHAENCLAYRVSMYCRYCGLLVVVPPLCFPASSVMLSMLLTRQMLACKRLVSYQKDVTQPHSMATKQHSNLSDNTSVC